MVIGLIGKKGCGKDTLANVICAKYPKFCRVAFADVLRENLSKITNINISDFDYLKRCCCVEWGKYTINGRDFYRDFGMLLVELVPNLFLDHVEDFINNNKYVIVTDVRRSCEVDLLNKYNTQFINILSDCEEDQHITECLDFEENGIDFDNRLKSKNVLLDFIERNNNVFID